jgi:hypothetical protein
VIGRREASDVADLGDEHRGQHRAHAVDGLHRLVARVVLEGRVDAPVEDLDLPAVSLD